MTKQQAALEMPAKAEIVVAPPRRGGEVPGLGRVTVRYRESQKRHAFGIGLIGTRHPVSAAAQQPAVAA